MRRSEIRVSYCQGSKLRFKSCVGANFGSSTGKEKTLELATLKEENLGLATHMG